ncbi:MAG TPA: 6-oxocyclohex-1-ene-1-carbonyl-CoA hydratase [Alphaproteobacteria bacterium]|jgi:6-oxo-cyclohex-1-ene-carbonyl-CoA hydrolase
MSKDPLDVAKATRPKALVDHNVVPDAPIAVGVRLERRPARRPDGTPADGLFNAWVILDNPKQLNALTVEMMKGATVALRRASLARDVVAIVLTATGTTSFSTGGNVQELAEYYVGNPQEFRQYMRLFMDLVTTILTVDKPVICRVNGMRLGGGQEIGMACDFSIAQDLARFGQAGPRHGSAPIAGATDFLPVLIGVENAMNAGVLCQLFSAHKAYRLGMISDVVPALKVDGAFVANPLVVTDRMVDAYGRFVFGEPRTGDELVRGKEVMAKGKIDLSLLDEAVEKLCTVLLETFPECTLKTIEELRKPKLNAWQANKESSRSWMAFNMMTEARAGFRAFARGTKETGREVDFVALRQALALGAPWTDELTESVMPKKKG